MNYFGYLSQTELLQKIESAFPLVAKPLNSQLFCVEPDDLMRRILEPKLDQFPTDKLPLEAAMLLYDEFSTISDQAVRWILPAMLRQIVKKSDEYLASYLVHYFEHMDLKTAGSSYNFQWLEQQQVILLISTLDYISETFSEATGFAQSQLEPLLESKPDNVDE